MLAHVLSSVSIGPKDIGEHASRRRPLRWLHRRFGSEKRTIFQIVLVLSAFASFTSSAAAQTPNPEFMPLDSAKLVLQKLGPGDPAAPSLTISSENWIAWLKESDAQVRKRLDVGE